MIDDGQDPQTFDRPKQLHKQEYIETLELMIKPVGGKIQSRQLQHTVPDSIQLHSKDIAIAKLETLPKLLPHFIQATDRAPRK